MSVCSSVSLSVCHTFMCKKREKSGNHLQSADYGSISKILNIRLIWWKVQKETNYFFRVTPMG